jgi:hypothetical protein
MSLHGHAGLTQSRLDDYIRGRFLKAFLVPLSSNGRTLDFGSGYPGSNPGRGSKVSFA